MYTKTRINAFQLGFFFLVPRCRLHNKKKPWRGFPLHFIYFKMTAMQEIQVNVSILCKKTLQEYFYFVCNEVSSKVFCLELVSSCLPSYMTKMLYLEIFLPVFTFVNYNARLLWPRRSHQTSDYSVSCL